MKKFFIISLAGIIILVGIIMIFNDKDNAANVKGKSLQAQVSKDQPKTAVSEDKSAEQKKYQPKSDSQGEVIVEVTPKTLGAGNEKNIFTVNLNTHSVELDFDFAEIMILKDDLGNSYKAIEWTGNSGWHHVSGDIIFPQINQQAKSIELQVNGINGVDRVFEWKLK